MRSLLLICCTLFATAALETDGPAPIADDLRVEEGEGGLAHRGLDLRRPEGDGAMRR
jgi:hypothetical protein